MYQAVRHSRFPANCLFSGLKPSFKVCVQLALRHRHFATHRSQPLSTSGSLLRDTIPRASSTSSSKSSSSSGGVGPFQLGINPNDFGRGENVRKWKQLSIGGKLVRTTAQSGSLLVILFGAGLAGLIVYALTTEMVSRNSPSVLYADSCERIRRAQVLQQYLPPNAIYRFHTSPPLPAAERPRHRNRTVPSAVVVDQYGREHLYLNFWIEAKAPSAHQSGLLDLDDWEWSFDYISRWSRHQGELLWQKSRSVFTMLAGEPQKSAASEALDRASQNTPPMNQSSSSQSTSSSWFSFASMFSSIRVSRASAEPKKNEILVHEEGEVHVDLVRSPGSDYFVYRYLIVDLPNSGVRNPTRVFIERAPDVRDGEGVMRFS